MRKTKMTGKLVLLYDDMEVRCFTDCSGLWWAILLVAGELRMQRVGATKEAAMRHLFNFVCYENKGYKRQVERSERLVSYLSARLAELQAEKGEDDDKDD